MKNYNQITFRKPFGTPFGNLLLMSVMTVLGALMTSCGGGGASSAPQHVKLIPKDAAMVVAFDVKQMVSKSVSFEDLFSQKSLEAMGNDEKEAKKGADNAKKFMNSGVDYLNIGYLFADGKSKDDYVLAIPLDDAAKFEKFLISEKEEIKTEGKMKYTVSKEKGGFIAWKDKNALMFLSQKGDEASFKKRAIELLEVKDDQTLLATSKSFAKALGNKGDIQVWIDSEKFNKMNGEETEFEGISLKDNFASISVRFEKGEVLVDADGETSPAISKMYEKIFKNGIDGKLSKNIPVKKPTILASIALNLKGIKEIMQERGLLAMAESSLKKNGTSVDEIISVFSGDILIVAESVNFLSPKAIVSIGLNDEKAFDAMLMKVSKGQVKKNGNTYSAEGAPAGLVVKDGVAYAATENYIEDIKKGTTELEGDMVKLAKDNAFAMYGDESIAKDLPNDDMKAATNVFANVEIKTGSLKDKAVKGAMIVRMKDKSKNSLLVLVEAVKNAPKSKKKSRREEKFEDDAPPAMDEKEQAPAKQQ